MLLMEIWQLSQLRKLTHKLFLQKTLRECMNTSQRKTLLKSLKYFYNSTVSEYQLKEHLFGHIICNHFFFYKNTSFISLFLFAMKEYQTCSSSQDRKCLLALKSQTVSKAPADILLHQSYFPVKFLCIAFVRIYKYDMLLQVTVKKRPLGSVVSLIAVFSRHFKQGKSFFFHICVYSWKWL